MKIKTKCMVDCDSEKLKQLIGLAKKGVINKNDIELIEWWERKVLSTIYPVYTADYNEIDLDEIPF